MKKETQIVSLGRDKKWTNGVINPPVVRASTMVFETMEEMRFAAKNKTNGEMFYGRRGGPTHFAFQILLCTLLSKIVQMFDLSVDNLKGSIREDLQ